MYKKILVVDDEQSIREFFQILLKKMSAESDYQFEMVSAEDGQKALELIEKQSFDVVISDLKMPRFSGLELLKRVRPAQPHLVFIMITAFDTSETAVQAMKMGAYDYIPKPFNVDEIKLTVLSALNLKKLEVENQQLRKELNQEKDFFSLVGQSESMKKIFKDVEQISGSTSNVLITGESGTGKEVIARAVHNNSVLKDKSFVAVNCGAIPDTLIESEMFGHKKGSFTGAVIDKKGFFELANGGSLFLDEIGELPLSVQPKLLRALQEKVIRMVGGTTDKKVDVRFITATNRELEKMVRENTFREDLFYRLNVVRLHIPPLRERKEDIPLFVEHFLKKYSQKLNSPVKTISDEVMLLFQKYNYPGNVRELENLVERLIILSEGQEIKKMDVQPFLQGLSDQEVKKGHAIPVSLPEQGLDIEETLENLEKSLLIQALQRTEGMKKPAADLLGLSLRTFRYRLQKYQLDDNEGDGKII